MNRNNISHRTSSQKVMPQFLTSRNSLGIVQTESLWDKYRKQIVYIIKTNQIVTGEIDVSLEGDIMTLEASKVSSYDKPFRTHNVGQENRSEIEDGLTGISFSEFNLKPGYQYTLISSRLINPKLIRVVLGFKPDSIYRNN